MINQIGMCWFNQIDTVDRDPAPAKYAMAQFRRQLSQFPDDELTQEAVTRIAACIDNIAGNELYVADYYNKTEEYKAALKRYEYIVEFYPGTEQSKIALAQIPKVAEKVKAQEKEAPEAKTGS